MAVGAGSNGRCRTFLAHEKTVQRVKESTPREEALDMLADFFKVLGDTTRIKILHALFITEMCVCDLSELLSASQSAISHQLKILRQAGLVRHRKEGKVVFYSLKDEHVQSILDQGLKHSLEPQR